MKSMRRKKIHVGAWRANAIGMYATASVSGSSSLSPYTTATIGAATAIASENAADTTSSSENARWNSSSCPASDC